MNEPNIVMLNSTRYNTEDLTALFKAVVRACRQGQAYGGLSNKTDIKIVIHEAAAKEWDGIVGYHRRSWRRAQRLGADVVIGVASPKKVLSALEEIGAAKLPSSAVADLAVAMSQTLTYDTAAKSQCHAISQEVRIDPVRSKVAVENGKQMAIVRAESLLESAKVSVTQLKHLVAWHEKTLAKAEARVEKLTKRVETARSKARK